MKRAWTLFMLASIFFVAYLFSPSFIGAVKGDGTRVIGPGWGEVVFYYIYLAYNIPKSQTEAFAYLLIIPVAITNILFCVLPFLYPTKIFSLPQSRLLMAGILAIGGAAYVFLIDYKITLEAGVGYGAYFWMAAAISALIGCLFADNKFSR